MGSNNFCSRTGVCCFRVFQWLRHGDQNGRMILTDGKPEIDDDTGLVSYHDQQGNAMQINRDDVSQIIER